MNIDIVHRYRAAVATYYETAHRPYREITADLVPLRAREIGRHSDAELLAEAVLRESQKSVVLGSAGTGKTTLLDRVAHHLASSDSGTPIFLPLHRYVSNLSEAIAVQLRRFVADAVLGELADPSGKGLSFLLDGLDEVAPPVRDRCTTDILALETHYPAAQIIVTSRTAANINAFKDWRILELLPLSDAEVRQILEAVAGDVAITGVFAHPRLLDIARRPLFLRTIAQVTSMGGDTRQYVLEAALDYFAWRGHSKSALATDVPIEAIGRALEVLAIQMLKDRSLSLMRSTAESLLAADEELRQWDIAQAVFDTDTVESDAEYVRFTHVSYVEAYGAKYLRSSLRFGGIAASDLSAVLESPYAAGVFEALFRLLSPPERSLFLERITTATLANLMKVVPREIAAYMRADPSTTPPRSQIVVEALEVAERAEQRGRTRRDVIVFAVHGFNTRGPWKNWLSTLLNLETDGVRFIYAPWDYGVFRLGILNPFARRAKVGEFQAHFNSVLDTYGVKRPDVCAVAHSFGTYIVGKGMMLFDELRFDRIILLRSVLPRAYPWNKLGGKCAAVLNECGGADGALLAAQFVPGLGASGRFGFKSKSTVVKENLNEFGEHSAVFGSRYMREKWIPFLRDGTV